MSIPWPGEKKQILTDTLPDDHVSGLLVHGEAFWRDHKNWLEERGYMLRPRYDPDWVPSWQKDPTKNTSFRHCEDGQNLYVSATCW